MNSLIKFIGDMPMEDFRLTMKWINIVLLVLTVGIIWLAWIGAAGDY